MAGGSLIYSSGGIAVRDSVENQKIFTNYVYGTMASVYVRASKGSNNYGYIDLWDGATWVNVRSCLGTYDRPAETGYYTDSRTTALLRTRSSQGASSTSYSHYKTSAFSPSGPEGTGKKLYKVGEIINTSGSFPHKTGSILYDGDFFAIY